MGASRRLPPSPPQLLPVIRPPKDPKEKVAENAVFWTIEAVHALQRWMQDMWHTVEGGAPGGRYQGPPVEIKAGSGADAGNPDAGWSPGPHRHSILTAAATALTLQSVSTEGTGTGLARADHTHDMSQVLGDVSPIQNGFPNYSTDTTISFDDGTLTFTISPTGASFSFWSGGVEYTKSAPDTFEISDVEGLHHIYYDASGILQELVGSFDPTLLISTGCFVASVYWNQTDQQRESLLNERHGREMDSRTHRYLHRTVGTRFDSGLGLSLGAPADSSGASDTHAQFAVSDGIIWDEDIRIEIEDGSPQNLSPSPASIPIYYLSGASAYWRRISATTFPVHPTGTGRPAWNNVDAGGVGVWGLTEITNNDYVLSHVFAVDDVENPIVIVMGQARYTTVALARAGADVEMLALTTGQVAEVFNEFLPIATVIFECRDAYANSVNARIRTTDTGDDYIDWRVSAVGSGGTSVSVHNNLSGLQGGDVTDRYHLTSAEHVIVTDPLAQRGGLVAAPAGITSAITLIVWYATFACTVLNVRGYRVGGTGATVNARINGASTHLASDLSVSSTDTWMDGGAVQNTAYAVGDKLEIMVVSVSGSPTQIAIQVDLRRT